MPNVTPNLGLVISERGGSSHDNGGTAFDLDDNFEKIDAAVGGGASKAYVDAAVLVETTRAETAEGELDTDLSEEAATRASADTAEAATRATADTTLQSNINSEATTRATADSTNATAISTETTRAEAAEALRAPIASPVFTGPLTVDLDNLGTNNPATAALIVENLTAATSTVPQNAGPLRFIGSYWTGTASAQANVELSAPLGAGPGITSTNFQVLMNGLASAGCFVVFKNNNVATALQSVAPPSFTFAGNYWTGSASAQETWEFITALGTGANPTTRFNLLHFGSSGAAIFDLNNGGGFGGTTFQILIPTRSANDNSNNAASTAYVDTAQALDEKLANKDAASGYAGLDASTLLKCPELPPWAIEGVNNSVVRGPVDGSGNPNYTSTATAATVATLTVNGNVTNLEMYIDGQRQLVVDQTLQVVLNNGGASAPKTNFVYLKKRATSTNLQSTDIGVTTNAPVFGNNQTAPSTTLATSSNPVYWFDPTTVQWKVATSNGGSFTVSPIIPLCVAVVDNTGTLLGIGYWGPRWTPWKIMEFCGQGTDGSLNVQSGNTTKDGIKNYSSLIVSGGNLICSSANAANNCGILAFSQSPIVVCGGGTINTNGLGNGGGAAATTTANPGNGTTSFGGPSGGGGGSAASGGGTGNAGAAGAGNYAWYGFGLFAGGAGGLFGGQWTLTAVASSGGVTTYTGTSIPTTLAGRTIVIAGFATGGNNGSFAVTSSTATTIVVATTTQGSETHAATATSSATVGAVAPVGQLNNAPSICGMSYFFGLSGRGAGSGGGDGGAASGGAGGSGGQGIMITAPGLVVTSTSSLTSNGTAGSAGGGTNGGGGGGGGGGIIVLYYGYISNLGTIASGLGVGGAGKGTGAAGGNGAVGVIMQQRIF